MQHTLFDFGCSRVTGSYTYCFMAGLYTGGCMQHTLFDFGCPRVTGSYTYCFMVGLYTGGCMQHTLFDFGCSRVTGSYTYCFMVGLYTGSCSILVVLVLQAPTRTAFWWVCTQAAVSRFSSPSSMKSWVFTTPPPLLAWPSSSWVSEDLSARL